MKFPLKATVRGAPVEVVGLNEARGNLRRGIAARVRRRGAEVFDRASFLGQSCPKDNAARCSVERDGQNCNMQHTLRFTYGALVSSSGVGVGDASMKSSRVLSTRFFTLYSETRT